MKGIIFLFKYLKKYYFWLLLYTFTSFVLSVFYLIIPLISGSFIDCLLIQPKKETILNVVIILVIVSIVQIIISYISSMVSAKLVTSISYDLEQDIYAHIQECSLRYINKDSAYITQRIISDSNSIISLTVSLGSGFLSNFIILISSCLYFIFNATIIVLVAFIFFLIYFFVIRALKKYIQNIKVEIKERNAKYYKSAQDQISNLLIIKAYNICGYYHQKLYSAYKELFKSKIRETRINYLYLSSNVIIKLVIQITLFIYCGLKIIAEKMTIGTFTILSSYLGILIDSIKYFINISQQLVESDVAFDRINCYLTIPKEKNGTEYISSIGNICVNNLSFGYGKNDIINQFSAKFEKGNIYQIIGNNGKGKTTLISLLIGLYLYDYEGEILYNSVDVKCLDMNRIREKCISLVLQDGFILEESFDYNLFLNRKYNTLESQLMIDRFGLRDLQNRSQNENTVLKDEMLSGGEIKKINILRALLKEETSLLILDEPTVYLDSKSKMILLEEIEKRKSEKIIILVSHDEIFKNLADSKIFI